MPVQEQQYVSQRNKVGYGKMAGVAIAALGVLGGATVFHKMHHSVGLSATAADDATFSEYLKFIAKYGKTNQTQEEFKFRLNIFRKNYQKIQEHNSLADSGKALFWMAVNQFTDLEEDEFMGQYASGLKVPKERAYGYKKIEEPHQQRRLSELPESVNWFEDGYVTRPMDQQGCGACWAFSTAAAVESLALISGYDKELTELSVQQLVDCDDQNYGCTGGWMYEGFEYVSKHGLVKKHNYRDFSHSKSTCSLTDRDLQRDYHIKDIGYVEEDGKNNQ